MKKYQFPIHPILFSLYPVLALMAINRRQVSPWGMDRSLIVALLLACILYFVFYVSLRNLSKASLLSSYTLLIIFTYGHIYQYLKDNPLAGLELGRHRILAPIYVVFLTIGFFLVIKNTAPAFSTIRLLNVLSLILVALPCIQISLYTFSIQQPTSEKNNLEISGEISNQKPDVYYIILDAYTRNDILQMRFDLDNAEFYQSLEDLGFYVAECSRSNYPETELSLASSLNMSYLSLGSPDQFSVNGEDPVTLYTLITQSKVRKFFQDQGYKIFAFETGYYWNQWQDADVYLHPQKTSSFTQSIRPFEAMLIQTTIMRIATETQMILSQKAARNLAFPYQEHIDRQKFILDQLPQLAFGNSPKFVYAHILIPHNPIVFSEDGSILEDPGYWSNGTAAVNDDYYKKGYSGQVRFINKKILLILKSIIQDSPAPPVIILQGDHGIRGENKHAILNAYYLPGTEKESWLYPAISPVNSFRILLNRYFSTNFQLLPDRSFYIDSQNTGNITEVPENSPYCKSP